MEENTNAYKPNFIKDGVNAGRLDDVGKAQELGHVLNAELDATENGMTDAPSTLASAAEELNIKYLKEDFLKGLTPAEKFNVGVMEFVTHDKEGTEINKNAFILEVDKKGREYLLLHPIDMQTANDNELRDFGNTIVFFCKSGVFAMETDQFLHTGLSREDSHQIIDWTKLGDDLSLFGQDAKYIDHYIPTWKDGGFGSFQSRLTRIDVKNQQEKTLLVKAVKLSERIGVQIKAKKEAETVLADPREIFEDLF